MNTTVLSNLKTDPGDPNLTPPSDLKASHLRRTLTEWFLALAHQKHPLEQADIDTAKATATALLGSDLIALSQQQEEVEARIEYLTGMIETELSGELRAAVEAQREG